MVDAARRKVMACGVDDRVRVERMAIEEIGPSLGTFDGALSNFGGLNCVADLPGTASALAGCVRPGGVAVVCVMGPVVPWEWLWFLARREPSRAFRRLHRGGAAWRGLTIRYPSIRRLRAAFSTHFSLARLAAIGALLPPPDASAWAGRHPRWLDALDRAERAVETTWPLPHLADHYLAEFQRTGPGVST
jgi:SAM-dependent methyltransferase